MELWVLSAGCAVLEARNDKLHPLGSRSALSSPGDGSCALDVAAGFPDGFSVSFLDGGSDVWRG
jgi:hypothetical protein